MRNLQCKTIVIIVLFLEVILITGGCSKKDDAEIYEKYGNTNGTNDDTTTSTKLYVSVGDEGTILTSSDGTTWTSRTSGTTNILNGVAYGNNTIVTVGNSGIILTSSDNGSTWDNRSSGTENHLFGVIYGNSKFMTVGKGGKIFTSDKGTTWTSETSATAYNLMGITYANSKFVAVGYNGNILTSSDGNS